MPFSTLGFRADAGDRIPAMLILSDIDPGKAPALRFDQYGLPTRGFGDRQVAQLRLISADGWGADWSFDAEELTPGTPVQLLGYLDIFDRPRQLTGVELTGPNGVVLRQALPVAVMLSPGHRYLMTGGITLPADAPAGRYTPRTILTK
ncbi:MAG: hypothetical protein BWY76_01561 [bacterium ADurb.Bin429]|nr:MAG: hypothetical protein BWY76_01561 [bacterium ADurb.Bin429]